MKISKIVATMLFAAPIFTFAYKACPTSAPSVPVGPTISGKFIVENGENDNSNIMIFLYKDKNVFGTSSYVCDYDSSGDDIGEYLLNFSSLPEIGKPIAYFVQVYNITIGDKFCFDFGDDNAIGGEGDSADTIYIGECTFEERPLIYSVTTQFEQIKLDIDVTKAIKREVVEEETHEIILPESTVVTKDENSTTNRYSTEMEDGNKVMSEIKSENDTNNTFSNLKLVDKDGNLLFNAKLEIRDKNTTQKISEDGNISIKKGNRELEIKNDKSISFKDENRSIDIPDLKDVDISFDEDENFKAVAKIDENNDLVLKSDRDSVSQAIKSKTLGKTLAIESKEGVSEESMTLGYEEKPNKDGASLDKKSFGSKPFNALVSRFTSNRDFVVSERRSSSMEISSPSSSEVSTNLSSQNFIQITPTSDTQFKETQFLDGDRFITITEGSAQISVGDKVVPMESGESYQLPVVGGAILLKKGWNLVSLPADTEISDFSIFGENEVIWKYDGSWKSSGKDLDSLISGDGFWVKMIEDSKEVKISGASYSPANSMLKSGWNLLGSGKKLSDPTKQFNLEVSWKYIGEKWTKNPDLIDIGEGIWMKK